MRRLSFVLAATAAFLAVPGSGFAQERTTNAPAIFTVKVTITDVRIGMSPNHAARGSTVTFILTNRGKKTHTFQIGDVKRGPGYGEGFRQTLRPNQQFTKVMYLDYRGVMRFFTRTGTVTSAIGSFRIT